MNEEENTPPFLYKVLSMDNWKASQSQNHILLSKDDWEFIHLAREDQLDRIIKKYWVKLPFVILKLDVAQLSGTLVYETNLGGINKYYHLYAGSIPLKAVVEIKIIRSP